MITLPNFLRRAGGASVSLILVVLFLSEPLIDHSGLSTVHAFSAYTRDLTTGWKNMGVYGGWMSDMDIDASTGAVYVVGGGYPGLYFSYDNGDHWKGIDPGFAAAQHVIVASDGSVFANFDTLSRSTDGGQSWVGIVNTSQAQYAYTIQDFDVDPNDPLHIVIGTSSAGTEGDGAVYITWDGGTSWSAASLDLPNTSDIFSVAIDPVDGRKVYAISRDETINTTPSYVFQSLDGGQHFNPVLQAAPGDQFLTVEVNTFQTVFAGSNGKLFRSNDGLAWVKLLDSAPWVNFIEFSPVEPKTVYIDGSVSNDNGETWVPFPAWQFLTISPTEPDLMFTSGSLGILRSMDGGLTWEDKVQGIENLLIWHTVSDPADNQVIYFSSENGVGRSFDGGQTWDFPLAGVDSFRTPLAISPTLPGRVYALNGTSLVVSNDNMDSWTEFPITSEISVGVTDMAVDPQNPDRIFIAHSGHDRNLGYAVGGLNMTEDGGQTWVDVPDLNGFPVNAVKAGIASTETVMYAAVGDGFGFDEGRGGVYRSNDLGHTWARVGLMDKMVNELEVDPNQGEILYAGLFSTDPNETHLLYRSQNSGETWEQLPLEVMGSVGSVGIDPDNTQVLLASTGNLLYKSSDRGDSWSLFYEGNPGEQFLAIHMPFYPPSLVLNVTAIPDLTNENQVVYLSTSKGLYRHIEEIPVYKQVYIPLILMNP